VSTGGSGTGGAGTGRVEPVLSAGCGKPATLRNGTHTITSGGTSRTYILELPDNYDSNHAYRLILGYHWINATAEDVADGQINTAGDWAHYGLLKLSGDSTIFIAPQGIDNAWPNTGNQDLVFTDDILSEVEAGLCIDTSRIFANGFNYGAGMAYAIACDRADVFRAVAVYSGFETSGCSRGTTPIAYFATHGLFDTVIPIQEGRTLRDRFVNVNGCTPQDPPEPAGSAAHICTSYDCPERYPVRWCAFAGVHLAAPIDGGNENSPDSWVPEEAWAFFAQF
jgi:poly(3-hydroxybutyrate) depolymerase